MTLNWQWATAFRWFTTIRESGAAWHEWPLTSSTPFPDVLILYRRGECSPCRRKFPGSPHLFALWERLPLELFSGRFTILCVHGIPVMIHRACSPASYLLLSLPEPTNISHSSSSSPLSQKAGAFFLVSHKQNHRYRCPVWVDGAPRAQRLLLQLWGSSSLLQGLWRKTAYPHWAHFNWNMSTMNCLQYEVLIFSNSAVSVNKQDIVLQVESRHTNAQIQSLKRHILVPGLLQLSDTT